MIRRLLTIGVMLVLLLAVMMYLPWQNLAVAMRPPAPEPLPEEHTISLSLSIPYPVLQPAVIVTPTPSPVPTPLPAEPSPIPSDPVLLSYVPEPPPIEIFPTVSMVLTEPPPTPTPSPTPAPTAKPTRAPTATPVPVQATERETWPTADPNKERIIDPSRPMVCLTFDDGPTSRATTHILDTLDRYQARATFFVVGRQVAAYPKLTRRIVSSGHELGNHTYDHKDLTRVSKEEGQRQLRRLDELVEQVTGVKMVVMRPPYGEINSTVQSYVGMPVITWNIDPRDWQSSNASAIADHVLRRVKDGDIILLHDLRQSSADAARILVPELQRRGFQLVTVSELFEARGVTPQAGRIYRSLPP